jgi:UDP-N-acetylglucosamine--N-acetylmuramyl-(pentapeptide) pyrophosphoryl-undecaprenol N-acetylglucosamine transferase
MKAAIACGGTGGHIFPGLATAELLQSRGHQVCLWLSGRNVESLSLDTWTGPVEKVQAAGFPSGLSLSAIKVAFKLFNARNECIARMAGNRPDILLAMGSYASVGPVMAAQHYRVPIILHEANVVPGRAVEFLSRWAKVVATGFDMVESSGLRAPTRYTGLPMRSSLLDSAARVRLQKDKRGPAAVFSELDATGRLTILVMGGSQGAHFLNVAIPAALGVLAKDIPLQVIHLAGATDVEDVRKVYHQSGIPASVHGFLGDMPAAYESSDVAICRSGAASCMELQAFAVPALLVPLPSARKDHQTANARVMVEKGVARILKQEDGCLSESHMSELKLFLERDNLADLRERMYACPLENASQTVSDLLEEQAARSAAPLNC